MKTQLIIALKFLLAMTVLTGIVYPLVNDWSCTVNFSFKS